MGFGAVNLKYCFINTSCVRKIQTKLTLNVESIILANIVSEWSKYKIVYQIGWELKNKLGPMNIMLYNQGFEQSVQKYARIDLYLHIMK